MRNKKSAIYKISIFIFVLSIITIATTPLNVIAAQDANNLSSDYNKLLESESLMLYYNTKTDSLALVDKTNSYTWKSSVGVEDGYDFEGTGEYWKKAMSSLFIISYTDMIKNDAIIDKAFSNADADIKILNSNNKFILDYYFNNLEIKVVVEIQLDKNNLLVNIPAERIEENGKYGLVALELMPFFGAANKNVDGYILYPDGCGAIMKYKDIDKRLKDSKPYKAYIYSPEEVDMVVRDKMKGNQEYLAHLPIYGIKNGDNAFLAVITQGEEETAIQVYPEGHVVELNWASAEFKYRHFYDTILSNITINGVNVAKKTSSSKADKEPILVDHEVCFIFLQGENANYSGMANSYRDYLIKNNALKKVVKKDSNIPMSLDLFMGIKEKRMIFDRFIAMTNFDQARLITEQLLNNDVKNLEIKLKGWSKGGYESYPINWPPERKLGGITELNKYLKYAEENNVKLFLQSNFTHALTNSGGFSKKNDVVIQGNTLPLTSKDRDKFILNPFAALERFKNFFKSTNGLNNIGLALENLGQLIYNDYNKRQPSSRRQTVENWESMFEIVTENKKLLAVDGGNVYVLKYVDRLFNVPINSSNYNINDETVPFYQMVVHGMIPYTSEPGNLFHDTQMQKLQWIEYGCTPYFELTYKSAIELKNTRYNRLFNSYYESWIESIINIYKEFNENFKGIWSENIVLHERINPTFVCMLYSNGTMIYINYDEKEALHNGYTVKPLNYLVIEKGSELQ